MAGFDAATTIDGVPKLEDGTTVRRVAGHRRAAPPVPRLGYNPMSGAMDAGDVERFGGRRNSRHHHYRRPAQRAERRLRRGLPRGLHGALPVRIVPALASVSCPPEEGIAKIATLRKANTDGCVSGSSRSSWTVRSRGSPPACCHRATTTARRTASGTWPLRISTGIVGAYHAAGVQLHIHTNGNEATEAALDSVEKGTDRPSAS